MVLHVAQEFIGAGQTVEVFSADVLLVVKLLQRKEGSARTEPAFLAPIETLQALHQKLDVADASAIEFDVDCLPQPRWHAPLAALVDSFPRLERSLDRREIDRLPIHKRLDEANKVARQISVTRRMPRLNEGLQFPVLGAVGVIFRSAG